MDNWWGTGISYMVILLKTVRRSSCWDLFKSPQATEERKRSRKLALYSRIEL